MKNVTQKVGEPITQYSILHTQYRNQDLNKAIL